MARFIKLYRPTYLQSLERQADGCFVPNYTLGPLRARIFGVRVPVLWACDRLIAAGLLK